MVSNLLISPDMLNKKDTARILGVSRQTLDTWLSKPEMRRILKPKIFNLPDDTQHTVFQDSRIEVIAKHLPPGNSKGGRRLSQALLDKIEADLAE